MTMNGDVDDHTRIASLALGSRSPTTFAEASKDQSLWGRVERATMMLARRARREVHMFAALAIVVAQMWDGDDHMGGGWWWVMGVGWLVFLAVVVVLAVVLIRHFTGTPTRGAAENTLAERFARGEIDEEDYRRRRSALTASCWLRSVIPIRSCFSNRRAYTGRSKLRWRIAARPCRSTSLSSCAKDAT